MTTKAVREALAPAAVRAFLVDDSELVLKLIPLCLALDDRTGSSAVRRRRAEEAFDEIAAVRPDLIIADVRLPGMDGVAMATEIRHENPDIRIILISIERLTMQLPPQARCADAFVSKKDLVNELVPTIRMLFPKVFPQRAE